ncbi:MAG: peptidoglycan-binding domain-containing protein [Minisyncoccia bacterium]
MKTTKKALLFVFVLSFVLPVFVHASFTVSLKQGSSGAAVVDLQNFLQTQGFLTGKIDGKFGPSTKKAVIAFQLANGLKGDGSFGPASRAKANAVLATSANGTNSTPGNTQPSSSTTAGAVGAGTPISGTLDLAQNSSYANQTVTAPQTNLKLADFSLQNNTTEAVNLNKIEIDLSLNSNPYIANQYVNNLDIVYGQQTMNSGTVANQNYLSPKNFILAAGAATDLAVYADVNSSIPLNSALSASVLVSGVSAVSASSVSTNADVVLSGQNISFGASSFSVSADSTTPPAKMVMAGGSVPAAAFAFTSVADNYTISQLDFVIPGLSSSLPISDVVFSDTATGTVLATSPLKINYDTGNAGFNFNSVFSVPLNGTKSITLSYDLGNKIDSDSANINLAPVLVYVKAANSKGTLIDGVASNYTNFSASYGGVNLPASGVTVNSLKIFKSLPILTSVPLDKATAANNSTASLYKFSVAAPANGNVSIKQLTFVVTMNDPNNSNPVLKNFSFLKGNADYTNLVTIGNIVNNNFVGLTTANNALGVGANTLVVSFNQEEVISAGQTETYTLKAEADNSSSSSISGSDSVSTSLSSDSNMISGGSYLKTVFSKFYYGLADAQTDSAPVSYYNLLWSDMSESFPNQHTSGNGNYTDDWYNGYGVTGLPLSAESVNI